MITNISSVSINLPMIILLPKIKGRFLQSVWLMRVLFFLRGWHGCHHTQLRVGASAFKNTYTGCRISLAVLVGVLPLSHLYQWDS